MADLAIPPLKIVGYEGVLGAATMLLLVLPIVQVRAAGPGCAQPLHAPALAACLAIHGSPLLL